MRKKSRSRPVEFKDLLMGTPQTMRRPSSVSAKGTLRKSAVLTVKQLSPQIGEITGVKRNCFPKNLQVLCRSPRMSFFYPCPGISPQRHQAHIFAQSYPIRTVIQFLICPSIGSQREGPKINPVCKFFEQCQQRQKEPVHSTSNQREMISRYIFDETMYRLCYSETLNVCFFRSAGRHCNGTAQPQSLSAAALCFISDIQLWALL